MNGTILNILYNVLMFIGGYIIFSSFSRDWKTRSRFYLAAFDRFSKNWVFTVVLGSLIAVSVVYEKIFGGPPQDPLNRVISSGSAILFILLVLVYPLWEARTRSSVENERQAPHE